MLKRLTLLLAALGMLLPVAVSALGLGEIRLNSALNEPLRAEIPLISIDAEEIDVLSVKLASRAQYEQAGIEQVPELRQLRFEPTTGADGKPVIRVTTRNAVAEPFLNFLIEVNWPSGRSVREYTLLLDPPTLMRGAPPVSQLPAVSEPAAARPPSVSASSTTPPSGGEYGPVIKGETLWVIAETVRPDPSISMEQVMLALQQANPEAFIRNNINLLKVGVVLRVPSRDEMTTLAADEARASAQAQAAEWEAYRGQAAESVTPAPRTETATTEAPAVEAEAPARLELVVPEKQPEAAPSAAPEGAGAQPGVGEVAELRRQLDLATEEAEARRLQNDELNNQIRELEEQVAALEKLIELSSDEMASLQQNLQQQDAVEESAPAEGEMAAAPAEGEAAEAAPAEGEQAAEAMHAEGEEQAEGEMAHAETPAASEQPAMAEPAHEEKAAEGERAHAASGEAAHGHAEEAKHAAPPPPPPPPPAPEPGLLEDPILLGGAAVILLALIGVIVAKRRGAGKAEEEEVAEDGSAQPFAAVEEEIEEEAASGGGLFGRLKGLFSRNKGEEVAEEAEDDVLFEAAPAAAPAVSAEAMPTAEASAEEPSFEAGEATGQDVLNQFAPEGVGGQEVEGEDPLERADVFLAYGRSEQAEEVLRGLLSREPGRVDAMVKLLEIYSANQDRASFERQLEDLHEALAGETGPHWERAIELARGIAPDHHLLAAAAAGAATAAVAESVPAEEEEISLDQLDTDELDLDFDFEPVYGDEGEGEADDGGEPLDITQEFSGGELGDLADEGAIDSALSGEAETEQGEAPVDLGFDLDGGDLEVSTESEELGGGLDLEAGDETPESVDELGGEALGDLDLGATDEIAAPAAESTADAGDELGLDLDMGDLTAVEEEAPAPAAEPPAAEAPADESLAGLDETLDGGDLGELGDLEETLAGGDLGDLDTTLGGDEDFGGFDAGADMIDTKLELASTYLDMDDFDGARGILDEVLADGSDEQKAKAQELLGRIPG
jgi:pilus assembly protein FimV